MHEIEQEATNESHIDTVTINSIRPDSKWSVLVAKLKTSLIQNRTRIPYKIDTDSDGNVMLLHILRVYFPKQQQKKLAATEIKVFS